MKKPVATIGVALAAISLGLGLVGCGKDSKSDDKTTTSTSTSTSTSTTTTTTSAQPSSFESFDDYLKANKIGETIVHHDTPGAPVIDLPVPAGWSQLPESEDAPYGGIVLDAPADPNDPANFRALLEKLSGNFNTDELLAASVSDLRSQQNFDGGEGQKSTLGGYPAYQILGSYTKDGAQRIGAQKTVIIEGKDGMYLLALIGRGPEADSDAIRQATAVVDEKTTITP
ncbi:MAG: LpqN/LpqT family lipoprotein [Mycobacterium sp.]